MDSRSSGSDQCNKGLRDMASEASKEWRLGRRQVQRWTQVFGAKYEPGAPSYVNRQAPADTMNKLFIAIRDNHVKEVARVIDTYTYLIFAKCFPPDAAKERTALYVASFFARPEIVELLLQRGADRQLLCSGVLPSAVIGYGRRNAVDEMKVKCMLQAYVDVVSVLLSVVSGEDDVLSATACRRIQLHFSEPIEDLIPEDLVATNCVVERLTEIGPDIFTATVRLTKRFSKSSDAGIATIQLPSGVACGRRSGKLNSASAYAQLD